MLIQPKQRVVIVGAGFAGLFAAKHLATGPAAKLVDVTIVDRNNYHVFPPLLYQVAAAEIEPSSIAYPIRSVFRHATNVRTVMAEVTGIDLARRTVLTDKQELLYDQLVLAAGSQTAYFGTPGAEEFAFGLKNLEEAVTLRNHILGCFEEASTLGAEAPEELLTVAVVGGGPTGLEYAGALAELFSSPLSRDYPRRGGPKAKVILIDGSDNVIHAFAEPLREYARKKLEAMGVEVLLQSRVKEVRPDSIILEGGKVIRTRTVVWSAGVQGNELGSSFGLKPGKGGRLEVSPSLQLAGMPEVHVAGDLALPEGSQAPTVAPNAIQQGTHVAKNILLMAKGEATEAFVYKDKGSMATIGRNAGVAEIAGRNFKGFLAWALWLFVHLTYLIGFRNRILVLTGWAWAYFSFEHSVRLIFPNINTLIKYCRSQKAQEESKDARQ